MGYASPFPANPDPPLPPPRAPRRPKAVREVHVSQHFRLGCSQPELDFVDVNVHGDVPLFVDPRALRLLPTPWGNECVSLIQNYFQTVLDAIRAGDHRHAVRLLATLQEPNETRLGLSRGRPRGHGMGEGLARDVTLALQRSKAIDSGLLTDLEDTILLVEGVDRDIVSDIATNIIRRPLITYTNEVCERYGIPVRMLASGPLWDPVGRTWEPDTFVTLPEIRGKRLLLVPKVVVRRRFDYDQDEYFRHYILTAMQRFELDAKTELVHLLKSGAPRVTKASLIAKYGRGKALSAKVTRDHPEILAEYRDDRNRDPRLPLEHEDFAAEANVPVPNWDALLGAILSTPPGRSSADAYHRAAAELLTALFYPALTSPRLEYPIHDGRKRLDIIFANMATDAFFGWLAQHYSSSNIIVECKNYTGDVGNPELDQLTTRFSPNRGRVGFLLCRTLDTRALFVQRCRDAANDGHGFVIALEDADLSTLVAARRDGDSKALFAFLKKRFDELVM